MRVLQVCLQQPRTTAGVAPPSIFSIRSRAACAEGLRSVYLLWCSTRCTDGRTTNTNHGNCTPLLFVSQNYTGKSCKRRGGQAVAPFITTFQEKVEIAVAAGCTAACKYCRVCVSSPSPPLGTRMQNVFHLY